MCARESKVSVKDIKHNKFTVGWAECPIVHHKVFGRSKCLADEGGILLGAATAYCFTHEDRRQDCTSRPYLPTYPRTLWAFAKACVKLETAHWPESVSAGNHTAAVSSQRESALTCDAPKESPESISKAISSTTDSSSRCGPQQRLPTH